MYQSHVILGWN